MEVRSSTISTCYLKKLPKPVDLKNTKLEVLNSAFFSLKTFSNKGDWVVDKMKGENFKPSAEIKYNAVNAGRETLSDAFGLHPDEDFDSTAHGNDLDLDVLPFHSLLNVANLNC